MNVLLENISEVVDVGLDNLPLADGTSNNDGNSTVDENDPNLTFRESLIQEYKSSEKQHFDFINFEETLKEILKIAFKGVEITGRYEHRRKNGLTIKGSHLLPSDQDKLTEVIIIEILSKKIT